MTLHNLLRNAFLTPPQVEIHDMTEAHGKVFIHVCGGF